MINKLIVAFLTGIIASVAPLYAMQQQRQVQKQEQTQQQEQTQEEQKTQEQETAQPKQKRKRILLCPICGQPTCPWSREIDEDDAAGEEGNSFDRQLSALSTALKLLKSNKLF